jgi:malonyl-CoA O-methyltransferase
MMAERKTRIAAAFSAQAAAYDDAAAVQKHAAAQLAHRIRARHPTPPQRILEIGCGTGGLSRHLAEAFPQSELHLTDLAPAMLALCRTRLGNRHHYQLLDGEYPENLTGSFDLIASSLAFQWFTDLQGALQRLCLLLAPGGRLQFATLGHQTFHEWRQAHIAFGLHCGTPLYPSPENFPWPAGLHGAVEEDLLTQHYPSGAAFVRSLKTLGAAEPAPGTRPVSTGKFRRLLASMQNGFPVTYHIIYAEISR